MKSNLEVNGTHKCSNCNYNCNTYSALVAHKRSHHGYSAEAETSAQLTERDEEEFQERNIEKVLDKYKCPDCGRLYVTLIRLYGHLRQKHGVYEFPRRRKRVHVEVDNTRDDESEGLLRPRPRLSSPPQTLISASSVHSSSDSLAPNISSSEQRRTPTLLSPCNSPIANTDTSPQRALPSAVYLYSLPSNPSNTNILAPTLSSSTNALTTNTNSGISQRASIPPLTSASPSSPLPTDEDSEQHRSSTPDSIVYLSSPELSRCPSPPLNTVTVSIPSLCDYNKSVLEATDCIDQSETEQRRTLLLCEAMELKPFTLTTEDDEQIHLLTAKKNIDALLAKGIDADWRLAFSNSRIA